MNIEDALREYDQKGRGLNVLPASSPAMIAIVEHARLVANPNLKAAGDEVSRFARHVSGELGYMPQLVAKQIVAAALTPGDTDER